MPSAVFDVPKATTLAACAIGSAACAELDSVGPKSISTLSWKMSFMKTSMTCSFLPCSSSSCSTSLLPLTPPAASISSTASCRPFLIDCPYWPAGPERASAAPSLMSAAAAEERAAKAANAATSRCGEKRDRLFIEGKSPWSQDARGQSRQLSFARHLPRGGGHVGVNHDEKPHPQRRACAVRDAGAARPHTFASNRRRCRAAAARRRLRLRQPDRRGGLDGSARARPPRDGE